MREIDDLRSRDPGQPFDPYAPPRAEVGEAGQLTGDFDPKDIPLVYLDHARAIKRVSWLNFLLALVWAPAAITIFLMSVLMMLRAVGVDPVDYQFPEDTPRGFEWLALTLFHIGSFGLNIAIGIALRRFKPWARWADSVIAIVFLLICLAYAADVLIHQKPPASLLFTSVPGICIAGLVLWTLLSSTSTKVFSSPYRERLARER